MSENENMDMLREIFKMQKALNDDIAAGRDLHFTPEEWIQKNILATISELSEVMDEVNFKWWKNHKPIDHTALLEELTDVLHFYVSMCLHAGVSADELFAAYCEKNAENYRRQRGLTDKEGYKPEK